MTQFKVGDIYGSRWRTVNDNDALYYFKFQCMSERFPMLIKSSTDKYYFIDRNNVVYDVSAHEFTNKTTTETKYVPSLKIAKLLDIRKTCELVPTISYTAIVGTRKIQFKCMSSSVPTEIHMASENDDSVIVAFIDRFGRVFQSTMHVFESMYDSEAKIIEYVPSARPLIDGVVMYIQQQ